MAFSRMGFDPEDGLNNKERYDTTPASEDEARAQVQSISDQLREYLNGTLLAELENAQAGASGAERIGSAAVTSVQGATVRAQIEDVKRQLDDVSAGAVSDGSVATAKLADGAVTAAKLADGAVAAAKLADGAVTKPKLGGGALGWTLVADSGALDISGAFYIPSQAGKNEMMFQVRNEAGTSISCSVIAPLDAGGVMIPPTVKPTTCSTNNFDVDIRTVNMTSATMFAYGLSHSETQSNATNLKRVFVYVR